MRDLSTLELGFVYGAGDSPAPPTKPASGCKAKRGGSNDGRGKHSKGNSSKGSKTRCGKGGSS